MAERVRASTNRKISAFQKHQQHRALGIVGSVVRKQQWLRTRKIVGSALQRQQQHRARRIVGSALQRQEHHRACKVVALVPKPGAKSDVEDSESSADELDNYVQETYSAGSSPPPSIAASLENLNLLSESDNESNVAIETNAVVQLIQQPSPSISVNSPSILTQNEASWLVQNSPCQAVPSPSAHIIPSPSPLASTSAHVPSPSVSTRSRRPRAVVTRRVIFKPKRLNVNWRCHKFTGSAQLEDKEFELPDKAKNAIEYFKVFLSDDIIDLIVEQTNLYSTQIKGTCINITADDIKDFIAVNLIMGLVKMPAYTDFWSQAFRYDKVANIMSLKKFQMMRRYLHFNDNLQDNGDRYFKVRPFLEKVRVNCLQVEEETRFSIDEMMVPYKGTRAGTRKQYIKNKPRKWGFKIFVRAGVSGMVYDFLVYGGEDTFRHYSFTDEENTMGLGAKVVLALSKSIRNPPCSVLFFDNFFTSIELLQYLRNEYGIFSLGTIRQNRLRGAEKKLPTDKNLKKKGRGSHAQVVCNKNRIAVVKWYDNKCVTAASTFVDKHPIQTVLRYKKDSRSREPVSCPNMIKQYNTNMGGVDLADMLVALYRTEMRGHRWYLPLFSQVLDICVNNAWLLYRRDMGGKSKTMPLKTFRYAIHKSLLRYERIPPVASNNVLSARIIKNPVAVRPENAVRYDQVGHIPTFTTKGRCRSCQKGQTKFFCQKCNVRLCLVEDRNCYFAYHTKNP